MTLNPTHRKRRTARIKSAPSPAGESRWPAFSLRLLLLAAIGIAAGCNTTPPPQAASPPVTCTPAWYSSVEARVPTGDGQGHGPDIASDEWKSVVEFRLGVRGDPGVPDRGSEAWCRFIEQRIAGRTDVPTDSKPATASPAPSFDCDLKTLGSIETLVCNDPELASLDVQLAGIFAAASDKAVNKQPPLLAAEQRGWIKGRNACWKAADPRECAIGTYRRRIAELQASYRLVNAAGPVRLVCDGNPANEIVVTYFETDLPTLIAERGDSVSLMYGKPVASGTWYVGRNESIREHQGKIVVVWGFGADELRCEPSL